MIFKMSDLKQIISNLEYVKGHINNINGKVNNVISYNNENHFVISSKDGNLLYSRSNYIISSFYACQNKLMDKINNELKFIETTAEGYDELDYKLSSKVGDL